jgi:hypothetical protein
VTNVVLIDAAAETAGADRLLAELAVKALGLAPGGAEAVLEASLADGAERRRLAGIARRLRASRRDRRADQRANLGGCEPAPIPLLFPCSPAEIPLLTGKTPLFHRVENFGSNPLI